jgi:hypothetical protein
MTELTRAAREVLRTIEEGDELIVQASHHTAAASRCWLHGNSVNSGRNVSYTTFSQLQTSALIRCRLIIVWQRRSVWIHRDNWTGCSVQKERDAPLLEYQPPSVQG